MTTPTGIPQYDATLAQGGSVNISVAWRKADKTTPVDLTGKVIRMAVTENGTRVLLLEKGVPNVDGEITTEDALGNIYIAVSGAATQSWDNPISYAVVADPGTVNAKVLAQGDFFMIKAVSAV